MASNINRVVLSGNLTKDPETREVGATSLCTLRLAVNASRKNAQGEWEDKPNYFDVNVWGPQGVNCAKYLTKGSSIVLDGRLEWQEWEQDGNKRQKVLVVAQQVQFLKTGDSPAASTTSSETDDIPF
jgi:single-strand DNA-binding protein